MPGISPSLTALSSMATRQILAELFALYQQRTGVDVALKALGGIEAAKNVRAGSDADVVILASAVMEKLEHEGYVVAGTRSDFALSSTAIAVRSGIRRFAIETESDIKQAVAKTGRFCYSTGPSGDHFKQLLDRWALADGLRPHVIQAPPGVPVADMLVRGDADIGVQQLSELLACPGIEILGFLPPEIQVTTVFTAGVNAGSSKKAAARDLIAFLVSSEAEKVKKYHGMEAPSSR